MLALGLGWQTNTHSDQLLNFPFNEGTGSTTRDTASGLIGIFGTQLDPTVDTVQLVDQSPSGQAGDRSISTAGAGFLMADDAGTQSLNITNGPITLESWVYIDPSTPAKTAEGILAYGNSYKMGLRSGFQVFTLYGIVDVVNDAAGPVPAGQWVHLAAAWEPGVGVHFFVNGVESFVADTNLRARPVQHNYLSIASEGLGNNSVAIFDRMRIHNALLTAEQVDSVASAPKASLASTLVAYNFDVAALPATNSVAPALPTILASDLLPQLTGPKWTNDTPSGLTNDFALDFTTQNPPVKEVVTVNYGDTTVDLGANSTNYTLQAWVKLPAGPMEERRVILRTDGPAPRIALSINANRTLHTTVLGTADFTTSVRVPNDERWHHIAVVMENFERLRFYLDGALRQTVNRTQTGAASAGGTARLLIGKESETRYFRGLLDRVIVNNDALADAALDYPAAPGLATFEAAGDQPADQLADPGSTVTFTANPTSATAATQQWHFRNSLRAQESTPIAGATGNTLTLNNVSASNEGFYFLVVTNQAGRSESYAAQLTLRSTLALSNAGFEAPAYSTGPIEEQNGWSNDQNGNIARVANSNQISNYLASAGLEPGQPVHGGNQALLIAGAGLATTSIRPVTGFESADKVTFDVWVRPLGAGSAASPTGNVFFTLENAAGVRAAAFRLGPNNSLDWGTSITGVWQASGVTYNENEWMRITFEVDYTAKTYDMLVNGVKANAEPIPFYTATSDRLRQIRIFRGANQAGAIFDDINVTSDQGGPAPTLAIQREAGSVTITWPAAATGYVLQATDSLAPANWQTVAHTTQGSENRAVAQTTGTARFFRLVRQ